MKKMKYFTALTLGLVLFTIVANAQEEKSSLVLPKFGLGIHAEQYKPSNILSNDYMSIYTTSILMPINLTQHFRIEPEVGLLINNSKLEDGDSQEDSERGFMGGIGAFGQWQKNNLNFYAGIRLMITSTLSESYLTYDDEDIPRTGFGLRVGPAVGFEYFLGSNFSLGGEVGLQYKKYKTTVDYPDDIGLDDEETENSSLGFDTGIFIRAYF